MTIEYREACSEVYFILANLEESAKAKIPQKIMKLFEKNKVNTYDVNIDLSVPLNNQILKDETKAILSLLYRKFLCNESERAHLEQKYKKELEKMEHKSDIINNIENTNTISNDIEKNAEFKNTDNIIPNKQELILKSKKISIFSKILLKIKNIFKIK